MSLYKNWLNPPEANFILAAPTISVAIDADYTPDGPNLSAAVNVAGYPAPTLSYLWTRNDVVFSLEETIQDASPAVYQLTVTATNELGTVSATSEAVTVAFLPVNFTLPDLTGYWEAGETVTYVPGTWADQTALSIVFGWYKDGVLISNEASIQVTAGEWEIRETATNEAGSVTVSNAFSAVTNIVVVGADMVFMDNAVVEA